MANAGHGIQRISRDLPVAAPDCIALEAIKEQKTIQEIASHYGVHPSQVTNWKRQAIQGAPELFADRRSQPDTSEEALKAELYQQIGQLQVELDWLKKKSGLSR